MTQTRAALLAALVITALTVATYWPVVHYGFINFDDNLYVTDNAEVKKGLSWQGLVDVWKFKDTAYYHPVTWYSHMLDVSFFGLDAGMHHLSSLLIHIANTLLLLAALTWMTGSVWPSAMVAAMFALHPINVDSVVWIAERKNLVSTLFWMLTTLAYIGWTRRPGLGRYGLVLACFFLGLMAKPMLVTLPFVFLLLDYWPLERVVVCGRSPFASLRRAVVEKIPLFILTGAAVALSSHSVSRIAITVPMDQVPVGLRLQNAAVSYVEYAAKALWPAGLTIYYPFPDSIPPWQTIGALALLAAVTAAVAVDWRRRQWLVTGWLWYLGTLVPVIGIIQGGLWPRIADRWAYVPLIGFFLAVVWEIYRRADARPWRNPVLALVSGLILTALPLATRATIAHWESNQTLFSHAMAVTDRNSIAYAQLSVAKAKEGDMETAIALYRQAVDIRPHHGPYREGLGALLEKDGQRLAAVEEYKEAIRIRFQSKEAHFFLGRLLAEMGNVNEGIQHVMQALELEPDYPEALNTAGRLLVAHGRVDEGLDYLRRALTLAPESSEIHFNMAGAFDLKGETEAALTHYRQAVRLEPGNEKALVNMGVAVIARGQLDLAIACFKRAVQIDPDFEEARHNLARATQAKRRFDDQRAAIESAVSRYGASPERLADLGDLYLSIKNYGQAAGHYRDALRIDPDYSPAVNNLAIAYAFMGRLPEAAASFEKVTLLNPGSEKAFYNLACVLSRSGDVAKAMAALEKAVSLGYDNWHQIDTDPDLDALRDTDAYRRWWPRVSDFR